MIKREAKFGIYFRKWLKAHPMRSAMFELKQTTSDSIPFSSVKEHQLNWLLAAKSGHGALYKPPDFQGVSLPCDYWYLRKADAWIVIKYPKVFCIINIGTFVWEKGLSKRKSLHVDRAKEIAYKFYEI